MYALLPLAVPVFRLERPAVDLRPRESTSLEIIECLRSGDLDVGVVRTPGLDVGDIDFEVLLREEMMLLLCSGCTWRQRLILDVHELAPFRIGRGAMKRGSSRP